MPERPVLFFPRVLPFNYRVAPLERLDRRLGGRLVVCSGMPPKGSSLRTLVGEREAAAFRTVRLRNLWLGEEILHAQPFGPAFRRYGQPAAIMLEESPRSLTQPLLMLYAWARGIPTVLWGHFSSNNRRFAPEAHWMDRYRVETARRATACVCYTDDMADLLRPYLPEERLFVARNTLDTDLLATLYDGLAAEGRAAVRRRLGLAPEAPVLAYIGRLIAAKGTAMLLDVFERVAARTDAALLVIGDGPEREAMQATVAARRLRGVRFLGAISEWERSAPYLYAADVMVQPGYLGLSVNHAFAFGLPVVSQAAPPGGARFHSPEVAFVRPHENGMLTPFGDREAMVRAVLHVLAHHRAFSERALGWARHHLTIDGMVDGLAAAIRYAEERSTRSV